MHPNAISVQLQGVRSSLFTIFCGHLKYYKPSEEGKHCFL